MAFAFENAKLGDLFIQKADASTIGDLADGVMKVFGETEKKVIGSRHGEKLYETLMTTVMITPEKMEILERTGYCRRAEYGCADNY